MTRIVRHAFSVLTLTRIVRHAFNANGVLFEQSGYPWAVNICSTSCWGPFFISSMFLWCCEAIISFTERQKYAHKYLNQILYSISQT